MVFRRVRSNTRGIGRGGPWKSRLFWALKWLLAKRVPFGTKKVYFVQKGPSKFKFIREPKFFLSGRIFTPN